jgi:hypothetical protein
MFDYQEQWVIINKETGTIIGDKVYISKKMAERVIREKRSPNKENWVPVELPRHVLHALYSPEHRVAVIHRKSALSH